ncbi:MAG TPA: Stp1/IreP family PP2C-type Ser/Thr phosphatase [Actinomycetota bacterium]|nr:Stp1/IreP family PP2C-type Ser/Thr phosphatase [Actinomycetota bacterium]
MSSQPELRHAVVTDVGLVRSNNEDAYLVAPPLFAVADGMGGHRAGEVASAEAIETLAAQAGHDTDSLVAAVHAANEAVFARATDNPALTGMGTTITAMLSTGGSVQIVHVGDSRAYLLRGGRLRRLTQDHTVVDRLAREGKISPADVEHHPQRSVLERALGVGPDVDLDVQLIDIHPGDRLLLCTDGLTSMLEDDGIRSVLLNEREPQSAAQRLVDEALQAGGKDNVTALVVDVPRGRGSEAERTAEQPVIPVEGAGPFGPKGVPPPPRRLTTPGPATTVTSRADPAGAGMTSLGLPAQRAPGRRGPGGAKSGIPGPQLASAPPAPPARLPEDEAPPAFHRRPAGVRLLIATAIVVPLLVIGLVSGWVAVHNAWYVGQSGGDVAVFRGVPGSFAGLKISTLNYKTTLTVSSLPQVYRTQVRQGISASGKANALHIVDNYRTYADQAATPPPTPPAAVTATMGASP